MASSRIQDKQPWLQRWRLSLRALAFVAVLLLGGQPRKCSLQQKWSALVSHVLGCDAAYAAKVGALMRSVLFRRHPAGCHTYHSAILAPESALRQQASMSLVATCSQSLVDQAIMPVIPAELVHKGCMDIGSIWGQAGKRACPHGDEASCVIGRGPLKVVVSPKNGVGAAGHDVMGDADILSCQLLCCMPYWLHTHKAL